MSRTLSVNNFSLSPRRRRLCRRQKGKKGRERCATACASCGERERERTKVSPTSTPACVHVSSPLLLLFAHPIPFRFAAQERRAPPPARRPLGRSDESG